jgi:DNA-binding response OmpR family regulator
VPPPSVGVRFTILSALSGEKSGFDDLIYQYLSNYLLNQMVNAPLRRMERYLSGKSIERKMYLSENVAVMYLEGNQKLEINYSTVFPWSYTTFSTLSFVNRFRPRVLQCGRVRFCQTSPVFVTPGTEMSGIIDSPLSLATEEQHGTPSSQDQVGVSAAVLNRAAVRRILIVEDDVSLSGFLCGELQAQGLIVEQVHDGEEALRMLEAKRRYDLLMLDLNLPKLDGISLIQRLRPTQPRLPILVLTARSRVEDKVKALETGADDCLTKPFSLIELLARVQALLRRNSGLVPNCSTVGDLTMYRDQRRVERNGRRIDLTPREFAILDVMMRNAGQPVSRATLLEEVWNMSPSDSSTNIVDVYMKYVRDKIDLPGEPRLTHTVRGFGYELRFV